MHPRGVLKLLIDREIHGCHVCLREVGPPSLLGLVDTNFRDVGHEHQRVVVVGEECGTPVVCLGDV